MNTHCILLVEDDDTLRSSLAFVLKNDGYNVLEARDGLDALNVLQRERNQGRAVDLLITDIRMPNMDGMELLGAVIEAEMSLPSMVISGHGDREILIDLLRMGCSDFLAKPFEPAEVLAKVAGVLDKVAREQSQKQQANAELVDANVKLYREADTARRDMENLKQEVDRAAAAYRDLMDCCTLDYGLDMELRNRTVKELGGDFAGTCCMDGRCNLLVADVAGHDLAASYQTVFIKTFFEENCRLHTGGAAFFQELNAALCQNSNSERMVTAISVVIDLRSGGGQVVCAGHPSLIRYNVKEKQVEWLRGEGDVLGLHEDVMFKTVEFPVMPGDRFFLYTDGLTGAAQIDGASGRKRVLTAEALGDMVEALAIHPLDTQVDAIWNHVLHFTRGKQMDDMLLMGVEIPAKLLV